MTTLGDVWAVTAMIAGISACAWALLMCVSLFLADRSAAAREAIVSRPYSVLFVGLLISAISIVVGIACLSNPLPGIKVVGWISLLAVMALSFSGSSGLVLLARDRLHEMDPSIGPYGSMSRGALLVVLPCMLPILGWFLFAPLVFTLGVGAAVRNRAYRTAPMAPPIAG